MKKFLTLMFALFTQCLFANTLIPIPPIPIDIPVSTLCKQQCSNNIQYLTFLTIGSSSGARVCPEKVTNARSCAPYACNSQGTTCNTTCSINADCSDGYLCINGTCSTISYYCADNATTVGSNGTHYDCSPYICQAGQCIKRCGSTNDCVGGFVCDIGQGVCVNPTPA